MGPRSLALLVLLVAGCPGPRPEISDIRLEPGPTLGHYRVEARVANRGRGRGQVDVSIRLRNRRTGSVVHQQRSLELRAHEDVRLVADVEADAGDWAAEVEAEYPPQ